MPRRIKILEMEVQSAPRRLWDGSQSDKYRDAVTAIQMAQGQIKAQNAIKEKAETVLKTLIGEQKLDGVKVGGVVYLKTTAKGKAAIDRDELLLAGVKLATIRECTLVADPITRYQLVVGGV